MDGDGAIGVVLLHFGGAFHRDEDDSDVVLFEEGSGVMPGGPGLLPLGVGYLLEQVKLRQFVDHGAVMLRSGHGSSPFDGYVTHCRWMHECSCGANLLMGRMC